ncbi:hypothetical protein NPIL_466691, partial [Nephila pilipes]
MKKQAEGYPVPKLDDKVQTQQRYLAAVRNRWFNCSIDRLVDLK